LQRDRPPGQRNGGPALSPFAKTATPLLDRIDSVYLFMWPEWRTELRSNRWHFARRWARLRPVVMIQPERASRESSTVEPEPRIDNCQILSIVATEHLERWVARSIHQTTQIGRYMRSAGHRQPLFWGYNPCLLMAYAALPAILRVYHATENYFDCEGLPPAF